METGKHPMQPPPPPRPTAPITHSPEDNATYDAQKQWNIRIKPHNFNTQSLEPFIHADLHESCDVYFYQDLARVPSLTCRWGWNKK